MMSIRRTSFRDSAPRRIRTVSRGTQCDLFMEDVRRALGAVGKPSVHDIALFRGRYDSPWARCESCRARGALMSLPRWGSRCAFAGHPLGAHCVQFADRDVVVRANRSGILWQSEFSAAVYSLRGRREQKVLNPVILYMPYISVLFRDNVSVDFARGARLHNFT